MSSAFSYANICKHMNYHADNVLFNFHKGLYQKNVKTEVTCISPPTKHCCKLGWMQL